MTEGVKPVEYAPAPRRPRTWLAILIVAIVHFAATFAFVVGGKLLWQATYERGKHNPGETLLHIGMLMQYPVSFLNRYLQSVPSELGWLTVLVNSVLWSAALVTLYRLLRSNKVETL